MSFSKRQILPATILLCCCLTSPIAAQPPRFTIVPGGLERTFVRPDVARAESFSTVPPPPLPTGVAIPEDTLKILIENLTSGNENVRDRAERLLLRGGPSAVAALTKAANEKPELYHRIVPALLERFVQQYDPESASAAAQALDELTASTNQDLQQSAEESLGKCHFVRRQRAIWKIEELGGLISYSRDFYGVDQNTGDLYPMILNIMLDDTWKGDEKDLENFKQLTGLRLVYLITGHHFTEEMVETLKSTLPDLRVETRGKAQLGIQASFGIEQAAGVTISMVAPGGAAHKAGLRANDTITEFDGKRIDSFVELVKVLQKYSGDEVVVVKYRRGPSDTPEKETKLTLQSWFPKD